MSEYSEIEQEARRLFDDKYLEKIIHELPGHLIDLFRDTFIQGYVIGRIS